MALLKSRDRINVRGGGLLKVRQLHPSPSDTWVDVGYLAKTDLDDTREMMEQKDEAGFFIDWIQGSEAPMIKTTLKQTSIDEINLVKNADGIYYEGYYYVKTAKGYYQEYNFPLCKIRPGLVLNFANATDRTIELELHMLAVIATTSITRAPTGYNQDPAVNKFYVVVENAAAINAPTDTAAAVKALVF